MKWNNPIFLLLMIVSMVLAEIQITGVVKDEAGSPIENVTVYLKSSVDKTLSDKTDASGEYAIVETPVLMESSANMHQYIVKDGQLSFQCSEKTALKIELFSLNGKRIATLVDREFKAGLFDVPLETSEVSSGVYLLVVTNNGMVHTYRQALLQGGFSGIGSQVTAGTISNTRSRPLDTLVFEGENYYKIEVPITQYILQHDQVLKKKGDELPDSFTKNVIFEEFTGLWCGYCPYGAKKIKDKTEQYGDRFIGVAIHINDILEIPDGKSLVQRYGGSGYPSCVVDRGAPVHPNSSDGNISTAMNNTASCGLAIDATKSGEVTITAGFLETISDDVRLTVYLLENKIANSGDYVQKDYDNVLWSGYTNDHSLTAVLSENYLGDQINADEGTTTTKTFTYDLSGTVNNNADNCAIVALLHIVGASSGDDQVLNALEVHVGEKKEFQ